MRAIPKRPDPTPVHARCRTSSIRLPLNSVQEFGEEWACAGVHSPLIATNESLAYCSAKRREIFKNPLVERNQSYRNLGRHLFDCGRGNKEEKTRGTLWAAYNGITELVDHHWQYQSRAQRLSWLWFGEGERIKLRAFEEAAKLAKN